jgi:serine/threonine protein kinase
MPEESGKADHDRIFKITGDELPPEVLEARKDPSSLFGKYILLGMLGRGGAGYVRKAWDTMLGQFVALKFLSREGRGEKQGEKTDPSEISEHVRDLLQEARFVARLRHAHIVTIFDVGCINAKFYIAMQYIEGKSLIEHVTAAQERGWPSPLYADPQYYLSLLCDVARAIDYAHTFSPPIIHCDLKPGNIMVGADGTAYVLDFGLARAVGGTKEDEVSIRGTPAYMAPEQFTGQVSSLGVWTDVYGLGGLIYVLLCGQAPIQGTMTDIRSLISRKPPERPSALLRRDPSVAERLRSHALAPHLSRLEEICMRCLAKRPEDRYRMASRVGTELQSVFDLLQGVRRRTSGVGGEDSRPLDPTASQQLLFKGLDPRRVAKVLKDPSERVALMDAFKGRLAARLNTRAPRVYGYPRDSGPAEDVQVLKVTPARIYLLIRGEVEAGDWAGIAPDRLIPLAEAAGASEPDDQLALGLLKMRAASGEAAPEEPRPAPPPAGEPPLELL